MNQFPRSILGAAIAAVLATPGIIWAQSADAALRGKAPANTAVTAKNVATGATRRTQANAEGYYTLTGLSPGTYRVDAGPGTETTVTVSVASTATLDLTASSGAVEAPDAPLQEITVEGRRLSEVRTSEVGATVSEHQIETVPQITRNFLEFADTVPGVVFEVDGSGRTKISGGAQNRNGVNLYIDGVGQKGYVRSGVSGQAGDTQGNPFPQLAIGEYKVITSNYKAEYDQISSAAITALSRSGTNEFSGEAFGTYSADNYRASTPAELDSDQKAESESKEYGIAFGGPIIQDRLHFFLTYEAKRFVTPVSVLPAVAPADVAAQLPAGALAQLGPTSIDFEEDLFFAKLDWALSERDSMQLSAKIRDEVSSGDRTGVGIARSATVDTSNDDTRIEFSWKHNADTWLNEVQFTYEDAFYVPQITNADANGAVYTWFDGQDRNVLAVDGADPRAGQNKGQKGWAVGDIITFSDLAWGIWRSHHQGRSEVQGRGPDRRGLHPRQPRVLLRRDRGGHRSHSMEVRVRAATRGLRLGGDHQRQAVRRVRAGRLDRQRSSDTQSRRSVGQGDERVIPRLSDTAVPAGFAQYGSVARSHVRPVARPVRRPECGHRHQRLHQHGQQPQSA